MTSYNSADLRAFVDDVDAVLREAVLKKKLKEAFASERPRLVSSLPILLNKFANYCIKNTLMKVNRETRDMPEIMSLF